MNILEIYVENVHHEEEYEAEWTKKTGKAFVKVDMTTNCYGAVDRKEHIFEKTEWDEIQRRGYYMG